MGHLLPDPRGCHGGLGGSVGDACMSRHGRLLPDVCGYPVSRIVSVDVSSEGDVVRLPRLPVTYFSPNIWGLATLTKLKNRNAHLSHNIWHSYNCSPPFTWYEWDSFFNRALKCFRGISKYHHFIFTSAPGVIFVEVSPAAEKERISLLKPNDILSTS